MSLGNMVIELSLDSGQYTINLKRADGLLSQFIQKAGVADNALKRAEHSTRSWGHALRDSVIVLSLIRSAIQNVSDAAFGWQRSIISVNADLQRSIAMMKSFSSSADEAVKSQEAIADVRMLMNKAASAPFDMSAITDSFVKLRVAGIDDTKGSLDTLIDSVAAFGGTSDNLKRASVAIQQMAGKGVVSMEELRQQLGESVPTAIQAMADGLGTTYDELVKQISLGRVKAGPAITAMMDELERLFSGRAEAMMDTWSGAVAQFQTSIKNIAAAFGGLEDSGYAENGYMSTLTNELRSLTDLMNSPGMIDSARELGHAMAEIAKAAAEGVRWIVENRDAIYEWGKALATVYALMKGASYIGSAAAGISAMGRAIRTAREDAASLAGVWTNLKIASESQAASAARQSAAAAAGATAMSRWGAAGSALTGVMSVLGGPIGIVAGLAISGGIAWYNYKQEVENTRKAVIELNGALTNADQLATLDGVVAQYEQKMNAAAGRIKSRQQSIYAGSIFSFFDSSRNESDKREFEDAESEFEKHLANRFEGAKRVAQREAMLLVQTEEGEIRKAYSKIGSAYSAGQNELLDKRRNNAITQEQYTKGLAELRKKRSEDAITLIETRLEQVKKEEKELAATVANAGERVDAKVLARYYASRDIVTSLDQQLIQQKETLNSTNEQLENILVGGKSGKDMKFNPLVQYLNSLAISVAKAGAKAQEENPHLAQLYQVVANMQGMDMKADPALIAKAEQLAAQRWQLEKDAKALKAASDGYKDSMERVGEIGKVVGGKLNKAENDNPWLKASTDAERYRDEIAQIQQKLIEYKSTAGSLGDTDLVSKIERSAAALAEANRKIDQYSIQDTAKRMRQQTDAISDSLLTQSEQVEAQYQRQLAWAQGYYNEHKALLAEDAEAYAAYQNYLDALQEKHQRDTESGLDKWIRENENASEKYKSLWGEAMDGFNDMVVDGLVEGKFEIADFVQFVLKELIKIQMAKMVAGIAGSFDIGSMFSSQQNVGSAAAASGYSTTGYAGAHGFANGGIMTQWGKTKLKQYANGGIAREPQLAVFGEGSMAEAYVPLPDGRTIPVTLQGQLSGGSQNQQVQMPKVSVNVINQSGNQMDAEQTGQSFNGEQYVVDVVLKAVNRPGPLRDAIKG